MGTRGEMEKLRKEILKLNDLYDEAKETQRDKNSEIDKLKLCITRNESVSTMRIM